MVPTTVITQKPRKVSGSPMLFASPRKVADTTKFEIQFVVVARLTDVDLHHTGWSSALIVQGSGPKPGANDIR